jgi:hypothetical protein
LRERTGASGGENGTLTIATVAGDPLQVTGDANRRQGAPVEAQCLSLREVMDTLFGGRCDLLKIDCEGAEFPILLQAPCELFLRIRRIALEYHDWSGRRHSQLVERLSKLGYHVKTSPNPVHRETGYLYAWRKDLTATPDAPERV